MKKILLLAFIGLLAAQAALADVPRTINYQGRLTYLSGAPLPDGAYALTIRFYASPSDPESSALWTDDCTVQTKNGYFTCVIGANPSHPLTLAFDQPYYVGLKAGSDREMLPRQPLGSVPYALTAATSLDAGSVSIAAYAVTAGSALTTQNADNATYASDANNLDGHDSSAFILAGAGVIEGSMIAAGAIEETHIVPGAVTQASAPFAPQALHYPATTGNLPKIVYGSTTSDGSGNYTLDVSGYGFSSAPFFTASLTSGAGFVSGAAVSATSVQGVTYNAAGSPAQATFNWTIIGQ
ncbi:MAG: hypothetical protein AB1439_07965 [candidate division FCPU426 bacterium]